MPDIGKTARPSALPVPSGGRVLQPHTPRILASRNALGALPLRSLGVSSFRIYRNDLLRPQRVVDRAYERDPLAAAAEYGAEFRSDIGAFVSLEAAEACVAPGVHERRLLSSESYVAFTDPSGGSADSFTLAIAHRERDGRVVLDCVRERQPPFSPEAV
jgi:hypothetical protein